MNDKELNNALEQLAEEVPPMPVDFHDRWMSAVRAEADAKADPAEAAETRSNIISLTRWIRILSVAAAFVFLIGGTLLYRNRKKSLSVPKAAVTEQKETAVISEAADEAVEEAAEAPAAGALPEAETVESVMYSAAAYDEAEEGAVYDSAVYEAAAYEAEEAEREEYEEAAETDWDAAESDRAYSAKSASGASLNMLAAEPAMPAPTEAPTAEPTAAQTEAPETEKKTGFLSDAGAFFADMGDFLLAALPYLAVLAVPAAVALILRRKKK